MPLNNLVDFSSNMTVHTGIGELQLEEIMATAKAFSNGQINNHILWDLRDAELKPFTSHALGLLKKWVKKSASGRTGGKIAIVASGRLYDALTENVAALSETEHTPCAVFVSFSMQRALEWLKSDTYPDTRSIQGDS